MNTKDEELRLKTKTVEHLTLKELFKQGRTKIITVDGSTYYCSMSDHTLSSEEGILMLRVKRGTIVRNGRVKNKSDKVSIVRLKKDILYCGHPVKITILNS